jgi:maleylacetate reductase
MGLNFAHDTLGQRVLFGSGQAAQLLREEVERLGSQRVMLIAATYEAEIAAKVTSGITIAATFDDVVQHVPIEKAELARARALAEGIDLVVCVGGGSTTGFAKAVAMTTSIPIVAVPTTYAGSEATPVWGLTEAARKTTGIDVRVLPVTVIYDASLTYSLPAEMSVASGLNALAHCVDSMWAPKADPINQAFAVEGIRALAQGLPLIVADPHSEEGREKTLYGAYLSAVSFGSAGSGIHHKICHVLGGTFNTPHAQTHATVLPYVLAFNSAAAPEAERRIAQAFDAPTALEGLQSLREKLNAPRALKDYGFDHSDIAEAVSIALPIIPANNPREVTTENLTALLQAAWAGDTPTVAR